MNDFDKDILWVLDNVWVDVNDCDGDIDIDCDWIIVEEYDINVDDVNEYVSEFNK